MLLPGTRFTVDDLVRPLGVLDGLQRLEEVLSAAG
jgi:hypothetical protein